MKSRKAGVVVFLTAMFWAYASHGVQDPGGSRRFVSSRWLEVESSPVLLFQDAVSPEDNSARAVAPGKIASYELGCVSGGPGVWHVSKIVGGAPTEKLRGLPDFTRRMIEQLAANACSPKERLAFVSVTFTDGARWSMYPGEKPKRYEFRDGKWKKVRR